jgi:hypothetical protein
LKTHKNSTFFEYLKKFKCKKFLTFECDSNAFCLVKQTPQLWHTNGFRASVMGNLSSIGRLFGSGAATGFLAVTFFLAFFAGKTIF